MNYKTMQETIPTLEAELPEIMKEFTALLHKRGLELSVVGIELRDESMDAILDDVAAAGCKLTCWRCGTMICCGIKCDF